MINIGAHFTICFSYMLSPVSFITTPVENENMEAQFPKMTQAKVVKSGKEQFLLKPRKVVSALMCRLPFRSHTPLRWKREPRGRRWNSEWPEKNTEDELGRGFPDYKCCGGDLISRWYPEWPQGGLRWCPGKLLGQVICLSFLTCKAGFPSTHLTALWVYVH